MSELDKRLANVSSEQHALLALRSRREATSDAAAAAAIAEHPETRFESFPLADLQQAYWLGRTDAVPLGGIASRCCIELETRGLDVRRVELAWNALVRRFEEVEHGADRT